MQTPTATPTPTPCDTAIDSLDALLGESLEVAAASKALKENRKKLSDGRLNAEEKQEIAAKIREWEATSEWKPAAVAVMFMTQACSCGGRHTFFQGVFQRQEHRSTKVMRWIKAETPAHLNLPKEQKHTTEAVGLCVDCVDAAGFHPVAFPTAFPLSRSV